MEGEANEERQQHTGEGKWEERMKDDRDSEGREREAECGVLSRPDLAWRRRRRRPRLSSGTGRWESTRRKEEEGSRERRRRRVVEAVEREGYLSWHKSEAAGGSKVNSWCIAEGMDGEGEVVVLLQVCPWEPQPQPESRGM